MKPDNDCDILQLHMKILEDDSLTPQQKIDMFDEVRKLMPAEQNRWTLRWIIWLLGAVVVSVPVYAGALLFHGWSREAVTLEIPAALLSVGSTALGALATFLTHYTRRPDNPQVSKSPSKQSNPTAAVGAE